MNDAAAFARLIEALRPWLGHLVMAGGWAHRLHRYHPSAQSPNHEPIRTRDVDFALSLQASLPGDIKAALDDAGFGPSYLGDDAPPVTHYQLKDDAGFYAEFLAPLQGSEIKRGKPDATGSAAGITAQKLRHLDLLLIAPWSVRVATGVDIPLERPVDILLPNPVSFIVQKLLIHERRKPDKQAQDILYIHDTLELFGGALEELRRVWVEEVRPQMPATTVKRAERVARELFEQVTDTIREAVRIPQDRSLSPEVLRAACEYGLSEILRT